MKIKVMNTMRSRMKSKSGAGWLGLDLANRRLRRIPLIVVASTLGWFSAAHAAGPEPQRPFADPATLDSAVPSPESVIGHSLGTGAVRYDAMVRYLQTLAGASPLVTFTPYGQTHEGRTLYFLTVTSEANHARLDAIRTDNEKLADPRRLVNAQASDRIIDSLPGIAWLAYSIHGDELSSTDAALFVAYRLAAGKDEFIRKLRDELVIHIDPLQNPDGRERYLNQLQHLTGKVPNPDDQALQHTGLWSVGRGNHYLFDLNRDWLMMIHPETRGRAEKILQWNPHLLVDSHEMGSLDTYLFDPPREPFNLHLAEENLAWRRRFSADQAKAFDRFGWSYYTREWYEEWYPGYTNAWANLLGAIGILYEQAGVNAASVRQHAGVVLTYHEAVHHQVTSSFANLETLRANRRDVLRAFFRDRQWAVKDSGDQPGKAPERSVFLVAPSADQSTFRRFAETLTRHGIEWGVADGPVTATNAIDVWAETAPTKTLPAGTLIVRAAQPHRRLLMALMEFDPHMSEAFLKEERAEIESQRGSRIYDITGWNPAMGYGLEAYWAGSVGIVAIRPMPSPEKPSVPVKPGYGFLIEGADGEIYLLMVRLLDRGCKVRVAAKPFKIGGTAYGRGSVLLRNSENAEPLGTMLNEASIGVNLTIRGVDGALCEEGPDLGTNSRFPLLHQPRVAIAAEWPIATTSFGWIWHLLDERYESRSSPINIQSLGQIDLRKYNVLILPDGRGGEALAGALTQPMLQRLKSWVESGGTLVAIGDSAAFLAGKDRNFSAVRLREDVLDQLPAYDEAVQQERAARQVKIDASVVWGTGPPPGALSPATPPPGGTPSVPPGGAEGGKPEGAKPDGAAAPPPPSRDQEALKRLDAWQRMFRPTGVLVAAEFDPEHWLTFGLPLSESVETGTGHIPVMISGPNAFMSRRPVATPVRLVDDRRATAEGKDATGRRLRLSGLLWPEARERLRNTAFATVERIGAGQLILFADDPVFRGYFEGSSRLLLNAILLGPGLGTSQPVPW